MANRNAAYPIKATSRSVGRKKARRLSWFVVGAAFGIGCAWSLTPPGAVVPSVEVAATIPATPAAPPPVPEAVPAAVTVVAEAAALLSAPKDPQPVELILPQVAQKEPEVAPVPVPAPESATTETLYPVNLELKAGNGDTLIGMLTDAGIAQDEAHNALQAARKHYNPKKMIAGQSMTVELDKRADSQNPIIASMTLPVSVTESVRITRGKNDSFQVKKIEKPLTRMVAQASGTISSSLYQTGVDVGIPPSMIGEIINAYSYDVDFQRDIQPGHSIHALYERLQTEDGQTAGTGDLIFAELTMKNRSLKVYRYTDKNGVADYYNENGEGIRKALLRTPINGARISSGFGMRNHPILGYSRMHRGIDFAAPTGTPIYAAGDGVVKVAGRKGGYGNYLQIRHSGQYSTAYAHISRFASGIKSGKKVKQGQIVAYVGTTGASTGPHLHYEVLTNGKQVNPSGLKFKTGNVLKGKELAQFRQTIEKIEAKIAAMPKGTQIAMADFERDLVH